MFAPVRVDTTAVADILLEVIGVVLSGWCLLWLLMELPVAFAANDRFPPLPTGTQRPAQCRHTTSPKATSASQPKPVIPGRPSRFPKPQFVRTHCTDCYLERRFRCKNTKFDDAWSRRHELRSKVAKLTSGLRQFNQVPANARFA